MNDGMPRKGITPFDVFVIVFLVAVALAPIILRKTTLPSTDSSVIISSDGTETRYPLDENITVEITSLDYHYTVVIADGKVRVTDADCSDLICVHSGEISAVGASIVCLPGHLIISIIGGGTDDSDFVAGR